MKKKQLQNLRLNKKVISTLASEKAKGGRTLVGGPCPGSVGGPCTSIQIPCTFDDNCVTLDNKICIPPPDANF
jgi:hypothetical protein